MRYVVLLLILFSSATLVGQSDLELHNRDNDNFNILSYIHSDTLALWTFSVKYYERTKDSTIQPIANIQFRRLKELEEITYREKSETRTYLFKPSINFDVYRSEDMNFCQAQMREKCRMASCAYPDLGSDIIKVKNYIFYNPGLCVSSYSPAKNIDYGRSLVYTVLANLDHSTERNLEFILNHIRKSINESS